MTILFIVESSGKISKISKILGKEYLVKASGGHIQNLDPKKMSIDFENNFEPIYIITNPKSVAALRAACKNADMVYLAADPDLEGEKIAHSLYEILKPKKYRRVCFNSITSSAIKKGIQNAGQIDNNLVAAQKTRRVLDRLYGYLISPLLQRQIGGKLSAGRVQSVAARIIIDRENEIKIFIEKNSESTFFRVSGKFLGKSSGLLPAVLYQATQKQKNTKNEEKQTKKKTTVANAKEYIGKPARIPIGDGKNDNNENSLMINFLKQCLKSDFIVHAVFDKMSTKSASPPFTTSTLQQEANRKFRMPIDITMEKAQKLYEAGYITYMRTDSVEISVEAHDDIKKVIEKEYGIEYYQKNVYKNKSSNAQEAHEAIRPTHPELLSLDTEIDDESQIKLYKLIWQRTIASQMKPAKIKTIIIQFDVTKILENDINNDKNAPFYYFQSHIENIIFLGFMIVYKESVVDNDDSEEDDNESKTNNFKGNIPSIGDKLVMDNIVARQEYLKPPVRFTEASLVKELEKIGIGRPATYVKTIKTIMAREYVTIGNTAGIKRSITIYTIGTDSEGKKIMSINEDTTDIFLGKDTRKIIPTNLGMTVNDFLMKNFTEMMDYQFTAKIEAELDDISIGKKIWHQVVNKFYEKLNPKIQALSLSLSSLSSVSNDKLLGTDENGTKIFLAKTKYGPVVKKRFNDKFVYAKITDPFTLDNIKLTDAIKLLSYPKILGKYMDEDVILNRGRYGFYLQHHGKNYNISDDSNTKNDNKKDPTIVKAIEIIKAAKKNIIGEFDLKKDKQQIKATVLNGMYGPYINVKIGGSKKKTTNYPIPKNINVEKITDKIILDIISKKKNKPTNTNCGSKTSTKLQNLKKTKSTSKNKNQ